MTTIAILLFSLKLSFPNWEAARDANLDEIIDAIRPAGLANERRPARNFYDKSARNAVRWIFPLMKLPREEARAWLGKFGIGPKP